MRTETFLLMCLSVVAILATACSSPNPVIVFDSDLNSETVGIWVMDADGSNQTRLTSNDTWNSSPSWSPDGSKIAYFNSEFNTVGIWVMDADGSNQTLLIGDSRFQLRNSSWSPDGSKIAFGVQDPNEARLVMPNGIWVMDADGSNWIHLTDTHRKKVNKQPSWSPRGSKIAFSSNRDGNMLEIYVMHADGRNQTRLTWASPWDSENPSWSPDGSKIAFDQPSQNGREIYVIDADGSNQVILAKGKEPSWSPDGSKIIFLSARDNTEPPCRNSPEIYVMDADGSNQRRLTNNCAEEGRPSWRSAE